MAGNLEIPLMSLYGTEWRERGYGLRHYPIYRPGKAVGGGGGFAVYVFSTYVLTHTMTMAHRIYKVY